MANAKPASDDQGVGRRTMLAAVTVLLIVIGVALVWAIAENAGRFEGTLIGVVAMIVGLLLASLIVESEWRRRRRTREPHER